MKYLKKFSLFEAASGLTHTQRAFLIKGTLSGGTWSLNPETGLVDVDGDFKVGKTTRTVLPVSFGVVTGNFIFDEFKTGFISLKGSPIEVGGGFMCSNNKLTSLEGAPRKVVGSFYCTGNKLTSLRGAPQEVGGSFYCSSTGISSLEGAPQEVWENFDCSLNELTSLEGGPRKVRGSFYCGFNQLTSLKGAPMMVGGNFSCRENPLTSLEGAPLTIGGDFAYDQGSTERIKWNFEGWVDALSTDPRLFGPFILDRVPDIDVKHFTPRVMFALKKNSPAAFDTISKRIGDGASTLVDLGELGF
jgi:hypothetical protein